MGDYLEEENPIVPQKSSEPMELKLHSTHPFSFACGGLVYFYCSFAIAAFLIFQKQQPALH